MSVVTELKDRAATFKRNLGLAAINTLGFEATRVASDLREDRRKIILIATIEAAPYALLIAGAPFHPKIIDQTGRVMILFALKALVAHAATIDLPSGRR